MGLDIGNLKSKLSQPLDVYKTLGSRDPDLVGALIIVYRLYAVGTDDAVDAGALLDEEQYEETALMGVRQIVRTVDSWTLTNNGQPVPLTVEGIVEAGVPTRVLDDIGRAIAKDQKRGEGKGLRKLSR